MKKGWFNNWKMRYVICSDRTLSIFKSKGEKSGNSFNVIDCTIKQIESKRWNRKFVFRVKISRKKLYFAAEDEINLKKWINAIEGKVQRASLLGANIRQSIENKKRRSSPMISLSRNDLENKFNFQINKFMNIFIDALIKHDDPQIQYTFAELCGEFLSLCYSLSLQIFDSNNLPLNEFINYKILNSIEERKEKLLQMKNLSSFLEKNINNILIPLQCIIDFCGKSIFFELKINSNNSLSPLNADILSRLEVPLDTLNYKQDNNGKIWLFNGNGFYKPINDDLINDYINLIDKMQIIVYDSQTLTESLKNHKIPIKKLPYIAENTNIPSIRSLIQTEIIARTAKTLFNEKLKDIHPLERNLEIIKFFNLLFGNSLESNKFWKRIE